MAFPFGADGEKLGWWAGKELEDLDAWSCSESVSDLDLDLLALAKREDEVVRVRVRVRARCRLAVKKRWWDERWEDPPPLRESGILVAMVMVVM